MEDLELLRRTLEDLRAAVENPDPYLLLMAGAHIRKCLMDGSNSLAVRVNRDQRQDMRFEVPLPSEYDKVVLGDQPMIYILADGFSPRMALSRREFARVKLDQFLSTAVAYVNGAPVTVYDVVHHVANVAGGVHRGSPKEEKAKALAEAANGLYVGSADTEALVRAMRGIADVVVEALQPLV